MFELGGTLLLFGAMSASHLTGWLWVTAEAFQTDGVESHGWEKRREDLKKKKLKSFSPASPASYQMFIKEWFIANLAFSQWPINVNDKN